jgi:hypothetical protein
LLRVALVATAGLIFAAGCYEGEAEILVKMDGSGTCKIRMLISKQAQQDIANALEVLAPSGLLPPGPVTDMMKQAGKKNPSQWLAELTTPQKLAGYGRELGAGVKLESARKISRGRDEEGFEALYSFPDVRGLSLAVEEPAAGARGRAPAGGATIKFDFVPGEMALLKVLPPASARSAVGGASAGAAGAANPLDHLVQQLIGSVKLRAVLGVEGRILRTNAAWRDGDSRVVIADVQTPNMRGTDIPQLLSMKTYNDLIRLQRARLPGVKIADPAQVLVIQFK